MNVYSIVYCHGCKQTWASDFQPDGCTCGYSPLPSDGDYFEIEADYFEIEADDFASAVDIGRHKDMRQAALEVPE